MTFLWLGALLGALCGSAHAVLVFRQQTALAAGSLGKPFYFALWTFVLWTLFGAYLLAFWLLGALGMGLSRLTGMGEGAR